MVICGKDPQAMHLGFLWAVCLKSVCYSVCAWKNQQQLSVGDHFPGSSAEQAGRRQGLSSAGPVTVRGAVGGAFSVPRGGSSGIGSLFSV